MSESGVVRAPSRAPLRSRLAAWLFGRRTVDLPIRIVAVFLGVVLAIPSGYESPEVFYAVCEVLAGALCLVAGWGGRVRPLHCALWGWLSMRPSTRHSVTLSPTPCW
jgi:hypothetical protein